MARPSARISSTASNGSAWFRPSSPYTPITGATAIRDIFLGKARASRIDPLRSALKRGIPFTSHNDTSVTPMDPLLSVWSAVNRLTGSGKVLGEDQTVSVLDALKASPYGAPTSSMKNA
ncbi:MAG: amidohydrolase family protein [Bilophila wadsworthia]